jgi:uncharacterized membrane protein YqjE
MNPLPHSGQAATTDQPEPDAANRVGALDVLRVARDAGGALITQLALHGQLARNEWAAERRRWLKMLLITLIGLSGLVSTMVFSGVVALSLSWDTAYRVPAMVAVVAVFALITWVAWRRVRVLAAESDRAFLATREELAADLALLKRAL